MSTQPDHHDLAAGALAQVSGFATDAEQIRGLRRHGVAAGVTYAELWASHGSHAGVMWLEPHAELAEHTHRHHAHHVWVVEGSLRALDRRLGPDSYAMVPPGRRHGLVAGPAGAMIYYLYLQTDRAIEH
jgi:hypothetical protein